MFMGHRLQLSPVFVFVSVMVWGWLWGVTGAFIAVPLLLALRASRETAVILAAILFVAQFSIIFSAAITNFGLLARQRVMAMPFLVLLLCFHKTRAARAWPSSSASSPVLATGAGTRWP